MVMEDKEREDELPIRGDKRESLDVLEYFHKNIEKVVEDEKVAAIVKELRQKPYSRRQVRSVMAQLDMVIAFRNAVEHYEDREERVDISQGMSIKVLKEANKEGLAKAMMMVLGYRPSRYVGKGKSEIPDWIRDLMEGGE